MFFQVNYGASIHTLLHYIIVMIFPAHCKKICLPFLCDVILDEVALILIYIFVTNENVKVNLWFYFELMKYCHPFHYVPCRKERDDTTFVLVGKILYASKPIDKSVKIVIDDRTWLDDDKVVKAWWDVPKFR